MRLSIKNKIASIVVNHGIILVVMILVVGVQWRERVGIRMFMGELHVLRFVLLDVEMLRW